MRKLIAISVASTLLGYAAVHFEFFANPTPTPEVAPAAVPAPAEPVVLAQVVEVTDLDPLLDPAPAAPAVGVPFDAAEPLEPVSAAPGLTPAPIPPSAD